MEGTSLKSRAVAFALASGAVVFILALLAGTATPRGNDGVVTALVIALVCGVMSWGSAERAIAGTAEAIDAMAGRIMSAAKGDLVSPTPSRVSDTLPELAQAMEGLFDQVRANLDSVHALALYDPVTTLPNRLHFRREAERILARIGGDAEAALLFVDLDRFKLVNDSLGHAQGDQLLMMVAQRLRQVIAEEATRDPGGEPPIAARLAGDEFTILFPRVRGADHAEQLGRRTLDGLGEPFALTGQDLIVGASIGVGLFPDHARDLTGLMRAADVAMYYAKEQGRGQVRLYTEALAARSEDRLQLEKDMRHAIERGEFELLFQPLVNLPSRKVTTAEALIRWNHPVHGVRLPGAFIDAAEESGLIVEIGDWVIASVAETLARWDRVGIDKHIAFNVSPRQIERADFFQKLADALFAAGAPPARLELEITETIAMQCSPGVLDRIARLRALGVSIVIDDFGTGYSNLSRLKDLPLDRVKLDRSLIVDVARSAKARAISHAVVNLVHGLGCEVVAEGVEAADQAEVLRMIGCDMLQGFYLAPPMSEIAFLDYAGMATPSARRMISA